MPTPINSIVIVGGGSAGWMTAASLVSQFKNKKITVIESANIPTVGVGESTVGGIRSCMRMVGIKDADFVAATDATYKLAIKFNNFYSKDVGPWYYPFGNPDLSETMNGRDDWFIKKTLYPETPPEDFASTYYPQMELVNTNKILTPGLDNFDFYNDTAFHFDAAKFGKWLKDNICVPQGVAHVVDDVVDISTNDRGIEKLTLLSGDCLSADLYIDCTGFKSLLIGETLKVPFKDYSHILPNNRAWATRINYTDKEKQLHTVTDCTAMNNGWVWEIPLWSRIGTGYVYSDKHVSPEDAKLEFITHLHDKGFNTDNCEFNDIKIRTGIHEKLWVKNVVAIGLSAAFLEPLESTGLVTTYDFAKTLCSVLHRGQVSQWDRDEFNLTCEDQFNYWTQFVAMHYALSHRDDTPYWTEIKNTSYVDLIPGLHKLQTQALFHQTIYQKNFVKSFQNDPGINCLAAGMNWNTPDNVILTNILSTDIDLKERFFLEMNRLSHRRLKWKEAVKTAPSVYQYFKDTFYKD